MKDYVLELDKPRKLVYDFDAWDRIAEKYGSDKEDFDPSQLKITAREVPFLIRIGLLWEDPELTEEGTKELLNEAIRASKYTIIGAMKIAVDAIFAQSGVEPVPLEVTTEVEEKKTTGQESQTQDSKTNENAQPN